MLMCACRHHVYELFIKHFWLEVTGDKTTGPNNSLFKSLKDDWSLIDANSPDTKLSRFDWKKYRGTWLEAQAIEASNMLKMIVGMQVFRNEEVIVQCIA